jgi:hypothetical protein
LFWSIFLPLGKVFSIDSLFAKKRKKPKVEANTDDLVFEIVVQKSDQQIPQEPTKLSKNEMKIATLATIAFVMQIVDLYFFSALQVFELQICF